MNQAAAPWKRVQRHYDEQYQGVTSIQKNGPLHMYSRSETDEESEAYHYSHDRIRPSTSPNHGHSRLGSLSRPTSFRRRTPEIQYTPRGCRWPPRGLSRASELYPQDAEDLIRPGATIYRGFCNEVYPSSRSNFRFYTMLGSEYDKATDRADFQCKAFRAMSLEVTGATESKLPWMSLEYPNMAFCFGAEAGTVTLNFWAGSSGSNTRIVSISTSVKPRRIDLLSILERLRYLENGLEEDDPDRLYHSLYEHLIYDPGKTTHQHYAIEDQIADLITVLSRLDWTDFSLPENQIAADFFASKKTLVKTAFFLQLVLSIELYLRIHSIKHSESAKRKLLPQLPTKIVWDLAVAQRWLENMSLNKPKTVGKRTNVSFTLQSKSRQIEALREFAWTLKWPNMAEVEYIFDERDSKELSLEERSSSSMAWFTGVILPGLSMHWIIMNALISCDRDTGTHLRHLSRDYPNSGFQYRASTYWSWQCIVGKVLGAAKGVTQVVGWVGPCYYSSDLKRVEVVRIKQQPSVPQLTPKEVKTMAQRSDPLGKPDTFYPVADYELLTPDTEDIGDSIRVEKLRFMKEDDEAAPEPHLYSVAVQFAVRNRSQPVRLRYDVSFIAAYPCHSGPHVLFYDFAYRAVKIDDVVGMRNWGPHGKSYSKANKQESTPDSNEVEEVLVIEGFGVEDNVVFARAWCSHWGVSAVTAYIERTCMACAIREAYAACVSVVILTDGGKCNE